MNTRYFALLGLVLLLVAIAQTATSDERPKHEPTVPGRPAVLQKTPKWQHITPGKEEVKSTINIPLSVTTGPLKLTGVAQGGTVPAPNVPTLVTTGPLKLMGVAQGGTVPAPNVPTLVTTGPLKLMGVAQGGTDSCAECTRARNHRAIEINRSRTIMRFFMIFVKAG